MKLHSIQGDGRNLKCGPTAIAVITGKPISEVKEAIYKVKGVRYVGNMNNRLVYWTLRDLGYAMIPHPYPFTKTDGLTFAAWLRNRNAEEINSLFLVQLTRHYVVVKGRKMIDNHTKEPVFIRQAPHRRKRVQRVFEITRKGE